MADKTPVRVVFNGSGVATGMAEFQSGESVGTAFGGTGLTSIGSSLQVLRVNLAGNGLEFGTLEDLGDIGSIGSTLTAPSNADFTIQTAGTGNIILNDLSIADNTISTNRSNDDLKINASGTGTVVVENLKVGTSGATVTTILDEDAMGTNSATALATQQSIKAYVDTHDANIASDTLTFTNKTFDVEATGNSISNIDVSDLKSGVLDTDISSVSGSDDTLASAKAIKAYVDAQVTASDLDFQADSGGALEIDLDSETLTFTGGTGIDTSGSGNAVTFAIDSTVTTLTGSQTLTNKILTSPTINSPTIATPTVTGDLTATALVTNTITSNGSNADLSIQSSGTGDVVIGAIRVNGTTLDSADSTVINVNENLIVDGTVDATGNVTTAGSFVIGSASMDETDLEKLDGITNGTAAANKALVADGDIDIASLRNVTATGTITAAGFTIGSAAINESELETIDSVTAGTVAASKAVVVDSSKDIAGFRNITITGDFIGDITTTDITSGSNADINIQPGGTGNVVLGAVTISGTTISSSDSTDLNINENLIVDGTTTVSGNVTASADLSVGDDLSLVSDASILNFGVNSEIKLTHVHDTGLLLTDTGGTPTLQLHDANESIASDGSKVIITSGGTAFNLPTSDGSANQALLTDGSGTLSFGTVVSAVSDDTLASVKSNKSIGTGAQTVDSFAEAATDAVHYVMVQNDVTNDRVSTISFNVVHNDTTGFVGGIRGTGTHTSNNFSTFTSDASSNFIRLRLAGPSADTKVSMYRIPLSTANTADATRGNTVTTSNTDVDSASESIDSFAHASFRGAKYFILIDNDSKTETSCVEALVVHDGTDAYISTYGVVNSGNSDLISLTAAIDGTNVVVSAAGLETNLNLTIHKILLSDNMTAAENDNQKVIGATTVSSSATALDTFSLDKANGAVYYVVGSNSSEGAFSIQEIFAAANFTGAAVGNGGFVSTKETTQLTFTGDISTSAHNSYALSAASTSGSNTTVNAYRINLRAE